MCFVFFLQLLSETFLILRRIERDMIKNVYLSSCKVPFIGVGFYWNLNFLDSFPNNIRKENIVKIRPDGAALFHAEGRTDRHDKDNSRFPQFCSRA